MELQQQTQPFLASTGRRSSTESLMEVPPPASSSSTASMFSMARRRWTPRGFEEHAVVEQEAGRMLDREGAFHQSRGRWRVERLPHATRFRLFGGTRSSTIARHWTFWDDWFHTLAYQRTLILMAILFLTYFAMVFAFAIVYLVVSKLGSHTTVQPDGSIITTSFCDMDISDHMDALYFSLSTMTTIGYGVSDYYFGGCYTPLVLVLMQVCTAITFDALAMGLLFQRLSRAKKRSRTVVFSNQAVIQRVQGMPYLLARVGEIREYQMIEVCVRCYCIMHERLPRNGARVRDARQHANHVVPIETAYFVTRPIKLIHPNEESIGPHILMSIPQVLVHQMDEASPLVPSPVWYDRFGRSHVYDFHHHHQHNTHSSKDSEKQYLLQQRALEQFWRDRQVEIVLLVEGTDEMTGASIQSKHSYRFSHNDLLWNRTFAPCVRQWSAEDGDDDDDDDDDELLLEETGSVYAPLSTQQGSGPFPQAPLPRQEDAADRFFGISNRNETQKRFLEPICTVDFDHFHDTVEVPLDSYVSAYIPRRPHLSDL